VSVVCKHLDLTPSAAHNSSDDSSATIRHEANSPNVCHSPSSTFSGKRSPSHGKTPAAVTDLPQLPSEAPTTPSEPAGKKAGAAAAAHASTSLEPLCPPDASEGPEAAAEYEAYIKRFAAGETLAQRWERYVWQAWAVLAWHEQLKGVLQCMHGT